MPRKKRAVLCVVLPLLAATVVYGQAPAAFEVPAWAFPAWTTPPPADPHYDDVVPLAVPGSTVTYTQARLSDMFAAPDWFPGAHPPMPEVVARGRHPDLLACAFCHLPDGTGRPENAALAGLPPEYIRAQVADMRNHLRRRAWTREPQRSSALMQQVAEAVGDAELTAAANYFSKQPMRRKVEIVESSRVPQTIQMRYIYFVKEGGGDEPLGRRLIEVPVDSVRHERRDPNVTYRAYVPVGSLARGAALATTGAGGRTIACTTCHGPGLKGSGPFPPLAGRSPSYLLRQLLAFRTGTRNAPSGAPMRPVVANLDLDDMIAVSAYAGSLEP